MDFETERRQIVKDIYFSSDEDYYRHSNQKLLMLINYSSSERTIHPFCQSERLNRAGAGPGPEPGTRDHDQNSTVT